MGLIEPGYHRTESGVRTTPFQRQRRHFRGRPAVAISRWAGRRGLSVRLVTSSAASSTRSGSSRLGVCVWPGSLDFGPWISAGFGNLGLRIGLCSLRDQSELLAKMCGLVVVVLRDRRTLRYRGAKPPFRLRVDETPAIKGSALFIDFAPLIALSIHREVSAHDQRPRARREVDPRAHGCLPLYRPRRCVETRVAPFGRCARAGAPRPAAPRLAREGGFASICCRSRSACSCPSVTRRAAAR